MWAGCKYMDSDTGLSITKPVLQATSRLDERRVQAQALAPATAIWHACPVWHFRQSHGVDCIESWDATNGCGDKVSLDGR